MGDSKATINVRKLRNTMGLGETQVTLLVDADRPNLQGFLAAASFGLVFVGFMGRISSLTGC